MIGKGTDLNFRVSLEGAEVEPVDDLLLVDRLLHYFHRTHISLGLLFLFGFGVVPIDEVEPLLAAHRRNCVVGVLACHQVLRDVSSSLKPFSTKRKRTCMWPFLFWSVAEQVFSNCCPWWEQLSAAFRTREPCTCIVRTLSVDFKASVFVILQSTITLMDCSLDPRWFAAASWSSSPHSSPPGILPWVWLVFCGC